MIRRVRLTSLLLIWSLAPASVLAAGGMPGMGDVHAISVKHLEWQGASTYDLEIEGWYGDGLEKIVYAVDAHKEGSEDTGYEFDIGWQKAVSSFWDAKVIARYEDGHDGSRNWVGAGLSGTLPYFIHFDGHLFTGEGDVLLDVELAHELPLNRHWKLETRLELTGIAGDESGFEEISFGLRLGYETVNRLNRYVGVEWQRSPLENTRRTALVAGISYWY